MPPLPVPNIAYPSPADKEARRQQAREKARELAVKLGLRAAEDAPASPPGDHAYILPESADPPVSITVITVGAPKDGNEREMNLVGWMYVPVKAKVSEGAILTYRDMQVRVRFRHSERPWMYVNGEWLTGEPLAAYLASLKAEGVSPFVELAPSE